MSSMRAARCPRVPNSLAAAATMSARRSWGLSRRRGWEVAAMSDSLTNPRVGNCGITNWRVGYGSNDSLRPPHHHGDLRVRELGPGLEAADARLPALRP